MNYIILLKNYKFIIGNSSSGIIEAPTLKVPTINVGNRQHGRLRAKSIIDVDYSKRRLDEIAEKAEFRAKGLTMKDYYEHKKQQQEQQQAEEVDTQNEE